MTQVFDEKLRGTIFDDRIRIRWMFVRKSPKARQRLDFTERLEPAAHVFSCARTKVLECKTAKHVPQQEDVRQKMHEATVAKLDKPQNPLERVELLRQ